MNFKTAQKLRDGKCCIQCGTTENINIHHIKPITKGGTHELNNLMFLCFKHHMEIEKRMKGFWG